MATLTVLKFPEADGADRMIMPFISWAWLLGGSGAFLALPLTLFVAVMLEASPERRWIASLMGLPDTAANASAAAD